MKFLKIIIFLLIFLNILLIGKSKVNLQLHITICEFRATPIIKKVLKRDLFIKYIFKIDSLGIPIKIVKIWPISDQIMNYDKLKTCINRWRIYGVKKGMQFIAKWKFKYGKLCFFELSQLDNVALLKLDYTQTGKNSGFIKILSEIKK